MDENVHNSIRLLASAASAAIRVRVSKYAAFLFAALCECPVADALRRTKVSHWNSSLFTLPAATGSGKHL